MKYAKRQKSGIVALAVAAGLALAACSPEHSGPQSAGPQGGAAQTGEAALPVPPNGGSPRPGVAPATAVAQPQAPDGPPGGPSGVQGSDSVVPNGSPGGATSQR